MTDTFASAVTEKSQEVCEVLFQLQPFICFPEFYIYLVSLVP
jgi:hypothetical protein